MWLKVDGALGKSLMVYTACYSLERSLAGPLLVLISKADGSRVTRETPKSSQIGGQGMEVGCKFLWRQRTV